MTKLPEHVEKLLRAGRRRTNRLRRGRALSLVATVSLAVLALAMAVDATATIFDDVARWALTCAVYLTAAGCALWAAIRLVRGRPTFSDLARKVDAAHPELQERLATLVDVATRQAAGEETGASDDLMAYLAREADARVAPYNSRREFPLGSLFLWLLPVLALVLLFTGVAVKHPKLMKCLAQRVLTPWVDTGNLYADDLEVRPGDLTALAGTNITVTVKTKFDFGKPCTIRISRWTGTGWDRERTTPMGEEGVFETVADLAESRWRYRVNCGPAVSRYYEVNVVPRPNYASFQATIAWPAYTARPETVVSNAEVAHVRAVLGSTVTFAVTTKDASQPALTLEGAQASQPATNVWAWTAGCTTTNTVPWTLSMTSPEKFAEEVGRGFLETVEDRAPAVALQEPTGEELALPPRGRLPLLYTANDDFGIAAAELNVRISGTTNMLAVRKLTPEAMEGTARRLATTLDLADLKLDNVGKIVITAVVRDACPPEFGGCHAATSQPIRVRIDTGAKDFVRQALDEMMKRAEDLYRDVRQDLEFARDRANELRNDVRNDHGEYKEHSERRLEELSKRFEEAREKLTTLERAMEEDGRFDPIAEAFRKMLEEEMAAAAQKLQQMQPNAENAAERAQAAKELPDALNQALNGLRPLEGMMKDRGRDVQNYERVKDMAERQESLAQQAEERAAAAAEPAAAEPAAAEADRNEQREWRHAEESLAHTADEMAWHDNMPQIAEASRQMHAAVRRSREEQAGRVDEGAQQRALEAAQQRMRATEQQLQEASARREEAAKIEAAHAQREAEAAAEAAQATAEENAGSENGQPEIPHLPYTEEERSALHRLHNEARDRERRAEQLERQAADELMAAEASDETREAMAEAIAALHHETEAAEAAQREFMQRRWNAKALAPDGKNGELVEALGEAMEKLKAAEQAAAAEQSARAEAKAAEQAAQQQGQGEPQQGQEQGRGQPQPRTSAQAARAAADVLKQALADKQAELGIPEQESGSASRQSGQKSRSQQVFRRMLMRSQLVPQQLRGVLSQEEWVRIRAVLGETDTVDISRVPEEYRDLVKRYFHVLAGEK